MTSQYGQGNYSFVTIVKHTQHYTLDSLLLLGACSNALHYGTRYENRTRLSALKGQRPNR